MLFVQERQRVITTAGKKTTGLGLHVVDELLPDNQSTEAAKKMAKARGWRIDPSRSMIFVDPTARGDELAAIRREFFGEATRIVKKARGDEAEVVEYGIDCVNAALLDVDSNVRLTVSSSLPRQQRSLLTVITRYHRGPNGRPVRDDTVDHAVDCLRYPVVHLLPIRRSGFNVSNAA